MTKSNDEPAQAKPRRVHDYTVIGTTGDGWDIYAHHLSPDYRHALEVGLKQLDDGVL